jgi:hypothetical protein
MLHFVTNPLQVKRSKCSFIRKSLGTLVYQICCLWLQINWTAEHKDIELSVYISCILCCDWFDCNLIDADEFYKSRIIILLLLKKFSGIQNPLCSGSDSHWFSKTSILSISSCGLCFPAYSCCHTGPSALSGSNFNDVSATSILIQLPLSSNSNCSTSRMRLLPWDRIFWSKCIQNIFRRFQKHFTDVWDCRELLNPYDWSLSDRNCEMTL